MKDYNKSLTIQELEDRYEMTVAIITNVSKDDEEVNTCLGKCCD